ncbi:MAG: SDR family NAD(P)-dependent oxidoreductase [Patescibacteria group bacterium]
MITAFLKDKVVLVTGGTGTFGNAFVKKVLAENQIKKLIIFSRDELKQSQMQASIEDPHKKLRFFLGDIRDLPRLNQAFHGVDYVVHAAALKRVDALEYNPSEAIKTNILGGQNVIDAALANNVTKCLLISTDKAVQPINLYGATKLAAEKLFVAANAYRSPSQNTAFGVVRYGNVVGSRGSFIEMIKTQRATGVITLTHEKMTRFWITIDKVMDVIIESLDRLQGGETFVPKMGNMPVVDVIKMLTPECEIKTIGMRPGEKLHEVLVTEYEAPRTKDGGTTFIVKPEQDFVASYCGWLDTLPEAEKDFIFASDNPTFLLTQPEAEKILKI